jgi:hypothetical protein
MTIRRQVPNRKQVVAIYSALKPLIVEVGERKCRYIDGHSDESVAEHLHVSINSVSAMRNDMWGRLIDHPGRPSAAAVADLQEALAHVAALYADLQRKHDILVTALHANKIIDCKHLRVGDPYAKPPDHDHA